MLQNEGLAAALQWLVSHMAERYSLHVALEITTDYNVANDDLSMLLFQLVRELLFNVVKHSGVSEALLTLAEDGENLIICVADCGRGFDVQVRAQPALASGGFGLYSVRERLALFGGQLKVEAGSGKGVRATVLVPREPVLPA